MTSGKLRIAILGGTGNLGSGLAHQLANAGYRVVIGSRCERRAQRTARDIRVSLPGITISGTDNAGAAASADVVIMTVPYSSHATTIDSVKEHVQGKVFVDATVPLVPPKIMRVQLPPGGSVAKYAQQRLGENVRVVSAFQNMAASHLRNECLNEVASDILVCGDDAEARETVIKIAESIGLTAWHAGPIENSIVSESLTSILIFLNRKYDLDGAGIRIVARRKG